MHLRTLLFISVISLVFGQDRDISTELNPGCHNCNSSTTLVYIKADSSHDRIHQLWDFTRGSPTVIYVISGLNSTLNVTWNGVVPIDFRLSEAPFYSFAASIDALYEYYDLEDNGHISAKNPRRILPLHRTEWTLKDSIFTEQEAMVTLHGRYKDRRRTGLINVKLELLPFKDYAVDLPHLIHTANSTLVDLALVNFTSSTDYNASRYAVHFAIVCTDPRWESINYTMRKSLDDEHTPGVFEIIEVRTPRASDSDQGGFLQFRPVGYTESERSVSSSTNAYISDFNRTAIPEKSTLQVFYRGFDPAHLLSEDMFISFGLPGDGYYKQHNFTSWSFTVGYGAPPVESFSLFVVVVICLGLGVPLLLALSGVTYVLVRRRRQRNAPARFTDEE